MNSSFFAVGPVHRRQPAFTLVELLVTMAVGSLLILFLFQLFNVTLGAWRRGESQNDTYREARAAMQMMVRDLSQTIAPPIRSAYPSPSPVGTPVPTATPPPPVAPVLVLDHYDQYGISQIPARTADENFNEEAYCLTNVPNNGISNLCAVGYFCAWMPDLISSSDPQAAQKLARAPSAFALMRQFLGSGKQGTTGGVFARFKAATLNVDTILSFKDVFERSSLYETPDSQSPLAGTTLLSSYIWDLKFRTPTTLQNKDGDPAVYPATLPYPSTLPAYVEIRFKALSEAAARQLEANGGVTRKTWSNVSPSNTVYQRIILPGTRQFVARAPIYGGKASIVP